MEQNQDHIDKIFKESLNTLHENPPANGWKNIAAKLDAEDAKKYKRKFILAKRFALTILLFLLGLVTVDITNFYFKNDHSTHRQIYQSKSKILTDRLNRSANNYALSPLKAHLPMKSKREDRKINHFQLLTTAATTKAKSVFVNTYEAKINHPVNLSIIPQVPLNSELISSYQSSKRVFEINTSKGIQPLILQLERNKRHLKKALSCTVFTSAVMARYYLQDDIPENTFAQNTIQSSLQTHPQQINRSTIEERENPELSYNAGVLVTKDLKRHLGIQTGIIFNKNYISILPQKVYATPDQNGDIAYKLVTSSGYGFVKPDFSSAPSTGDSLYTTVVRHNLQYLTIPVLLTYSVLKNKVSFSGGLGLSLNFLASSSIQTELENAMSSEKIFISRLQGTRLLHLSLMANAEIQYWINRNWALTGITSAACAFTPVTRSNVVKTYPYNFSFGLGISHRLH